MQSHHFCSPSISVQMPTKFHSWQSSVLPHTTQGLQSGPPTLQCRLSFSWPVPPTMSHLHSCFPCSPVQQWISASHRPFGPFQQWGLSRSLGPFPAKSEVKWPQGLLHFSTARQGLWALGHYHVFSTFHWALQMKNPSTTTCLQIPKARALAALPAFLSLQRTFLSLSRGIHK